MRLERLKWVACVAVLLGVLPTVVAQSASSTWTVKPEWVRAHEEFLASDAMQGRGSATHDEEVTATYVASEFLGYGLKTAPGMTGYLQKAEVVQPVLDGHATITADGITLAEGSDFHLMIATGQTASGPLLRVDATDAERRRRHPVPWCCCSIFRQTKRRCRSCEAIAVGRGGCAGRRGCVDGKGVDDARRQDAHSDAA